MESHELHAFSQVKVYCARVISRLDGKLTPGTKEEVMPPPGEVVERCTAHPNPRIVMDLAAPLDLHVIEALGSSQA